MRRPVGIILSVLVLVLVGAVCLLAGRYERRLAIAQEDAAVLDFVDPEIEYEQLEQDLAKFGWLASGAMKEIRLRRAMLQYWQADYADLTEVARASTRADEADEPADPDMQALAANALYRVAERGPQDRAVLLQNLDAAIRAYTEALRAGAGGPDVAFNYELAVRMRQEVGAGKRRLLNPRREETKSDPNMHGAPGEPPKDLKVEQFQIRIPVDPRDMKQSQEEAAGTGGARRKRG